mmetsp:Transcript_25012/g.60647  ORF Transcript_25012/g.60647 Transcript_25012/m.60647 type:complete len:99 (-) Transcript_25012:14-310(-)
MGSLTCAMTRIRAAPWLRSKSPSLPKEWANASKCFSVPALSPSPLTRRIVAYSEEVRCSVYSMTLPKHPFQSKISMLVSHTPDGQGKRMTRQWFAVPC